MKNLFYLMLILVACRACSSGAETEKFQNDRNNVVNVREKVKEIKIEDVFIGSITGLFLIADYLVSLRKVPENIKSDNFFGCFFEEAKSEIDFLPRRAVLLLKSQQKLLITGDFRKIQTCVSERRIFLFCYFSVKQYFMSGCVFLQLPELVLQNPFAYLF